MCGRFVQKSERRIITEEFYILDFLSDVFVSYNVSPGQNAGVIINEGKNLYSLFKWGLVPSWSKDKKSGYKMINARAETVAQKPSFRSAFAARRCLVPADGFYEWKKSGSVKVPFYIFSKTGHPFSLGGLWETWQEPDGNLLKTFTIITTEANASLKNIHDRMPVIVPPDKRSRWLDGNIKQKGKLLDMLEPYEGEDIGYHEVSRFVNSPKNNSPECIRAATD
jgi:putative SOS response-associated peptidase YedK